MRKQIGLAILASWSVSTHALAVDDGSTVKGSGATKVETRKVPDFHSVIVSATLEATVTVGAETSVTLRCDDNLLSYIKTEVTDGVLTVKFAEGTSIRTSRPQTLAIVVPSLDSIAARGTSKVDTTLGGETKMLHIEAGGAALVRVSGLEVDSIEVVARDKGRVELASFSHTPIPPPSRPKPGEVKHVSPKSLTIHLSGASSLKANGSFESARVRMEGASQAEIGVTVSIEGDLSGASTLKVGGDPKTKKVRTSDASSVIYAQPRKLRIEDMIKGEE